MSSCLNLLGYLAVEISQSAVQDGHARGQSAPTTQIEPFRSIGAIHAGKPHGDIFLVAGQYVKAKGTGFLNNVMGARGGINTDQHLRRFCRYRTGGRRRQSLLGAFVSNRDNVDSRRQLAHAFFESVLGNSYQFTAIGYTCRLIIFLNSRTNRMKLTYLIGTWKHSFIEYQRDI